MKRLDLEAARRSGWGLLQFSDDDTPDVTDVKDRVTGFRAKVAPGGFLRTATLSHLRVTCGLPVGEDEALLDEYLRDPEKPGPEGLTVVVFRRWKKSDGGGIIALFPEIPSDLWGRCCLSYEHVGQHGGACCHGVVDATSPTKPEEYADLKAELEAAPYRYRLKVVRRTTQQHQERRLVEARRLREVPVCG